MFIFSYIYVLCGFEFLRVHIIIENFTVNEQEPERHSEPDLTFTLRRYKRYVFVH